jgi:tetratricopeptide (TPR) repeat protein
MTGLRGCAATGRAWSHTHALVAVVLLLLAGCASLRPIASKEGRLEGLPDRMELTSVPFFPQESHQCGPAALATVLSSAGAETTPQDLVKQVYLPGRRGSLQPELLAATRRAGLLPYPLAPEISALLREVAARNPVVVLQNLRLDVLPQWHYAVVVGYDLIADEVVLRSGTERRLAMKLDDFARTWERAGKWAFVALAPDRLPATASEAAYIESAVALERVSRSAARTAYQTALRNWPRNLTARIGLGNVAYALGELDVAQQAYRQAAVDHPESGDAWNNLAQTLHDQHRDAEALSAARRAVAIGGQRREVYESTLAEIERRPR